LVIGWLFVLQWADDEKPTHNADPIPVKTGLLVLNSLGRRC